MTICVVNSERIDQARLTKDPCKREKKESEMNEHDRLIEKPSLFERLSSTVYLSDGFEQVKKEQRQPRHRRGDDSRLWNPFGRRAKSPATGIAGLDLQTLAGSPSGNTQAGWQGRTPARHTDGAGSRGTDDPEKVAGTDL